MQGDNRNTLPLAIAAILITGLALSLGDALFKQLGSQFAIWQVFVLRSTLVMPVLLALLLVTVPRGRRRFAALGWVSLRSTMLVAMWVGYYAALPNLDLGVAAAAFYTSPIFITLLSAQYGGDRVGPAGWIAVLLGFSGVLFVVRPSAAAFNWYSLLPVLAAFLYACSMILTRTKCRSEHPLMLALALNAMFIVVGGAATLALLATETAGDGGGLFARWAPMAPNQLGSLSILALATLVGSIGTAIAYQNGPPNIIGTLDFAYVAFALAWGYLFFGEIIDMPSAVGILLIVAAGLVAVRR